MSAVERLAAATWGLSMDPPDAWRIASAILAADPTLAQDIEDGTALRLLREALPEGWWMTVGLTRTGWWVKAWSISDEGVDDSDAPTLAAAADACREALVAK